MALIDLLIDATATNDSGAMATASLTVQVNMPSGFTVQVADQGQQTATKDMEIAVSPEPPAEELASRPLGDSLTGHGGGEKSPLPGASAIAKGAPGYRPDVETSRQTWSGWASR